MGGTGAEGGCCWADPGWAIVTRARMPAMPHACFRSTMITILLGPSRASRRLEADARGEGSRNDQVPVGDPEGQGRQTTGRRAVGDARAIGGVELRRVARTVQH